ncbi:MAG TPA: DUF5984 family protein [Phycisphaerae bacterium]|nr:DUF5984 family protein [Phycisphaerae bacterium]HRW53049.1 DUF5984 family protein [Phycisphaerae bacterium]
MADRNPLIQFELTPIDEVMPWELHGVKSLHWYGLTRGWYNIRCGDADLYRTNDALMKARPEWNKEGPFVVYTVARLHMDLLHILPHVLNPVPSDVVDYVRTIVDERAFWRRILERWHGPDAALASLAIEWRRAQGLVTGYDRTMPTVRIWTEEDTVTIRWFNDCGIEPETGLPWNAIEDGEYSLSKSEFISEVRQFHERLMSEMAGRVEAVVAGCLPDDVEVDIDNLLIEQRRERPNALDRALATPVNENWDIIRKWLCALLE